MTIEAAPMAANLVAGLMTGGFYFFGLWWTVRRLSSFKAPGLFVFLSFLLRSAIALAIFHTVAQGGWANLLMCLAGFTVVRLLLVRRLGFAAANSLRRSG